MVDESGTDYAQKLDSEIDRWSNRLDELKRTASEKADSTADDARMEYEKRLQQLEEKRQDARSRVDALRATAGDAGEELKRGAREAVDDLRSSVERARETIQ